jgi:lysophospholipase
MARTDEGFFSGRDGTRLFWRSALPDQEPTSFLCLIHGYNDHSGRYGWLTNHLVKQGTAVMALDYRGHGKADGSRSDCKQWSDYLDDVEVFWARVRGAAQGLPTFVLGHSHGGLIATHFLLRKPEGVKGLILTSPFYKTAFDPPALKVLAAKVVGTVLPGLHIDLGLKIEELSRDVAWQNETKADPLYQHQTTPRWFANTTRAQLELAGKGAQLTVPLLMCTGGADPIVSTPTAKAFFDTVGSSDKTYKEYPGSRHEVFADLDREVMFGDISSWISAHR